MTPRAVRVVIAATVVVGGLLLPVLGWGTFLGFPELFGPVFLLGGAIFPFVAAWHVGLEAWRMPSRLLPLGFLLAGSMAGAAGLAWWGRGGTPHFLFTYLAGCIVGAMGMGAMAAEEAYLPNHPGREWLPRFARRLWMGVLVGAVLCLSLPLGSVFQRCDVAVAKAWVERAAMEVRAAESRTGRPPGNLSEVLSRIGPPPRLVPDDGGYLVTLDATSFAFRIADPSQFLPGWWRYEGKSGTWIQERF